MTAKPVQLRTPLGEEVLALHAGDHVELSGLVYTARDEAHLRMQKEGIPFHPQGAVIYHCGPVIQDKRVVAAGPTTSARMNELSGFLFDKGVRALIGKGGMGTRVLGQLKNKGVYLALSSCGHLLARKSLRSTRGIMSNSRGLSIQRGTRRTCECRKKVSRSIQRVR